MIRSLRRFLCIATICLLLFNLIPVVAAEYSQSMPPQSRLDMVSSSYLIEVDSDIIGEIIGFSETISIEEFLVSERAKELDAEVLVELANSIEHDNRARFGTPNDFGNVFDTNSTT